jgi:hypothetical protein
VRDFQRSHKAQRINASLRPDEALRKTPDVRRHATEVRDSQRSHKAQWINASLKRHEALRKQLLDQEPVPRPQGNDVAPGGAQAVDRALDPAQNPNDIATAGGQTVDRALDAAAQNPNDIATVGGQAVDRAPDAAQNPNDIATAEGQAVDRALDEVKAVPSYITEREAGQTVGIAADAAQNTPPSALSAVMAMVMLMGVVALGFINFLFRRTYAKRVLAFGAMRLSQPPPDYARPLDLSWPPRNQVEADASAASTLESVKKALETIEEAAAEMASSRQLRRFRR